MINASEYRAMAAEHHRLAGMCRSQTSREQHFRLEQEFLALADTEECLHGAHASQSASQSQLAKWVVLTLSAPSRPSLVQCRWREVVLAVTILLLYAERTAQGYLWEGTLTFAKRQRRSRAGSIRHCGCTHVSWS
jgi:hypothetical protein